MRNENFTLGPTLRQFWILYPFKGTANEVYCQFKPFPISAAFLGVIQNNRVVDAMAALEGHQFRRPQDLIEEVITRWDALKPRIEAAIRGQEGLALDNVRRNLVAAGLDTSDLVKLTFYIVGDVDADERRRVIASKLGNHRPCMTLLFISSLATPALKVEIDAWASRAA